MDETYGCAKPMPLRVVPLWWNAIRLSDDPLSPQLQHLPEKTKTSLLKAGLYVFEGCHDSRPDGGILYIGQVGAASERDLTKRVVESSKRVIWKSGDESGFFADVWGITLRWASIEDQSIIKQIESLLIAAHAPSFNAQKVRSGIATEAHDLLVMNGGAKGRLMPVLCGHYYNTSLWT